MKTQTERVLAYMRDFGSISPLEAMADLGCLRLAARIWDLRRAGHSIGECTQVSRNRYGQSTHYARYYLATPDTIEVEAEASAKILTANEPVREEELALAR